MNRVALILAVAAGLAVNMIAAAGMWAAATHPEFREISDNYVALMAGALGVMVGGLVTYIGSRSRQCDCPCHILPEQDPQDDRDG